MFWLEIMLKLRYFIIQLGLDILANSQLMKKEAKCIRYGFETSEEKYETLANQVIIRPFCQWNKRRVKAESNVNLADIFEILFNFDNNTEMKF